MSSFDKKVVLITGGAGGLGKAIAAAFLASGACVCVSDINSQLLSALPSEPGFQDTAERLLAVEADVTNEESARELVEKCVERFGGLDVLVNNAGVMGMLNFFYIELLVCCNERCMGNFEPLRCTVLTEGVVFIDMS